MDCQFATIDGERRVCRTCGFVLRSTQPAGHIHRRCPQADRPAPAETPSTRVRADVETYCGNGQATVAPAEIEWRLSVCQACSLFTGDNCRGLWTSCAHRRDWMWAVVGFGAKPPDCPRGNWSASLRNEKMTNDE